MRRNGVLTIGLLVLAFTAVGFYGNFVQWSDVETVTAKVLNTERQVVLKGEGHTSLEIAYPVGKDILHATVSVAGSDPGNEATSAGISVSYMRKSPERVIPVSVLKDKQRTIYVTLVIGAILTAAGLAVGMRKKSASTDKMKEILKVMDQPPERPLAADEEMRIFKDATTGKFYSKIAKKVNPDCPEPRAAAPYPAQESVDFVTAERIVVPHGGRSYELSIHYHREVAEGDDIIRSSAGGETYLVHPMILFRQLIAAQNRFMSNLRTEEVADLAQRPCLVVEFMDESREYHTIAVDGLRVSVPGKYLGLNFRLIVRGDELFMVTQGLLDDNADALPLVVTTLTTEFVSATSARYDADDEMWYSTETLGDGTKYVGEWKDGEWHGQGTLTWSDGSKYVGSFTNGELHGQGTWTHPDGRKYVGEWKSGCRDGSGTATGSDGRMQSGTWERNVYKGGAPATTNTSE